MYYDDPLAAAIMMRDFGVTYNEVAQFDNLIAAFSDDGSYFGPNKLYIHPDSYDIFKPIDGDRDEDGYTYDSKIEAWVSLPWDDKDYGECFKMKSPEESKIAKRNNKPFFHPKSNDDA